jgi:hypothetical protein
MAVNADLKYGTGDNSTADNLPETAMVPNTLT